MLQLLTEEFFASGTVISKSPDEVIVGWGKQEAKTTQDANAGSLSFYFPDFFLEQACPWHIYKHTAIVHPKDLLQWLAQYPTQSLPTFNWHNHLHDIYKQQFAYLKSLFDTKKLEKAVPFVYENCTAAMTPALLRHIMKSALEYLNTRPGYLYGNWVQGQGILGVTPELLFQYNPSNPSKLSSQALAGTFFHLPEQQGVFNYDQKLQHEHQVVVKDIVNSLTPFGQVSTQPVELLRYANILHLLTKIEVNLHNTPKFMDIVHAMHPTPALGAYPREEGLKWLKNYQKLVLRRSYGAPVGYQNSQQEASCYVAIRNLQWTANEFFITAGGGIVKESQLEEELEEIQSKIVSIKSVFKL